MLPPILFSKTPKNCPTVERAKGFLGTGTVRESTQVILLLSGPRPSWTKRCPRPRRRSLARPVPRPAVGAEANARHVREARSHGCHTPEGFDSNFNATTFKRAQMEAATGDFIRRCTNLVTVGGSGIGKRSHDPGQSPREPASWLTCALSNLNLTGCPACLADKTLPARLRRYPKPDALIADESGSTASSATNACSRPTCCIRSPPPNQKRSTALVTNVH